MTLCSKISRALVFGLGLGLSTAMCVWAQPAETRPAKSIPKPRTDGKVLGGIKQGTDAAGRGIDRAGDATQRGVNSASERASRPVRNIGESFGRKLEQGPGGGRTRAPAATGPAADGP